jgi:hypothetical protein
VLEVSFTLDTNTLLTVAELENLENNLKKNVSFKIIPPRKSDLEGADFFVVYYRILYQRILNKTL